jgi:putative acetyltransferase
MQSSNNRVLESLRCSSRNIIRELGFLEYEKRYMGLNPSEVHALIEIDIHSFITNLKLAEFLKLDKSTTSRLVKGLFLKGLVEIHDNPKDDRSKLIKCSMEGIKIIKEINIKASNQVKLALGYLTQEQQQMIEHAMALYSSSLKKSRLAQEYEVRIISANDNLQLAVLIKSILAEFGAAREGFAFQDESLNNMYKAYNTAGSGYDVVTKENKIYGGIGIAKLSGAKHNICELQKMYLVKEIRGLGLGQILMERALKKAKSLGYEYCYLETLSSMEKATKLYHKFGFKKLANPLGNTGHFGCDNWYLKKL